MAPTEEVCMLSDEAKIIFFVEINILWHFNHGWVFFHLHYMCSVSEFFFYIHPERHI